MSNEETGLVTTGGTDFNLTQIEKIGTILANSKLFGVDTPEKAIALCLIAHAEGQHPATAAQDYDIIQGRPALRANSLLARFQAAGGRVEWTENSDEKVTAVFTHPAGGSIEVTWDEARIKQAGLHTKDNHRKYPAQMKRARCISEGVRAVFPGAAKFYVPEEVAYFEPKAPIDVTESVDPGKPTTPLPKDVQQQAAKPPVEKPAAADTAEDMKEKLEAARIAAANRNSKTKKAPEGQTSSAAAGHSEPTGELLDDEKREQILAAFKKHDIGVQLLEKWRGLKKNDWTESVLIDLRNLFTSFLDGDIDKEGLKKLVAGE